MTRRMRHTFIIYTDLAVPDPQAAHICKILEADFRVEDQVAYFQELLLGNYSPCEYAVEIV